MTRGAVVIAHSEYAVRQPLRDALERAGYNTIAARDTHEAIDALRDRMVCLAILQGALPGGGARRVHLWVEDGAKANVAVGYLNAEGEDDLHHTRHGLSPAFIASEPVDSDEIVRTVLDLVGPPAARQTTKIGGSMSVLLIEDDDEAFDEVKDLLTWGGDAEFKLLGAPSIQEARRILHTTTVDCILLRVGEDRAHAEQVIGDLCHVAGDRPVVALMNEECEHTALAVMRQGCTDVLDLPTIRKNRSLAYRVHKSCQRSKRMRGQS